MLFFLLDQGHLCINGLCSSGCRSNADCANDKACIEGKCRNPCSLNPCGKNAECLASDHKSVCLCPTGYVGDAFQLCRKAECSADSDCAGSQACVDRSCINPCLRPDACGTNAQCRVENGQAVCLCPPGFVGNPAVECRQGMSSPSF